MTKQEGIAAQTVLFRAMSELLLGGIMLRYIDRTDYCHCRNNEEPCIFHEMLSALKEAAKYLGQPTEDSSRRYALMRESLDFAILAADPNYKPEE